ncbi:hypothetical protein JCM11641_000983 [Rhodosporidiobolus odoratus]
MAAHAGTVASNNGNSTSTRSFRSGGFAGAFTHAFSTLASAQPHHRSAQSPPPPPSTSELPHSIPTPFSSSRPQKRVVDSETTVHHGQQPSKKQRKAESSTSTLREAAGDMEFEGQPGSSRTAASAVNDPVKPAVPPEAEDEVVAMDVDEDFEVGSDKEGKHQDQSLGQSVPVQAALSAQQPTSVSQRPLFTLTRIPSLPLDTAHARSNQSTLLSSISATSAPSLAALSRQDGLALSDESPSCSNLQPVSALLAVLPRSTSSADCASSSSFLRDPSDKYPTNDEPSGPRFTAAKKGKGRAVENAGNSMVIDGDKLELIEQYFANGEKPAEDVTAVTRQALSRDDLGAEVPGEGGETSEDEEGGDDEQDGNGSDMGEEACVVVVEDKVGVEVDESDDDDDGEEDLGMRGAESDAEESQERAKEAKEFLPCSTAEEQEEGWGAAMTSDAEAKAIFDRLAARSREEQQGHHYVFNDFPSFARHILPRLANVIRRADGSLPMCCLPLNDKPVRCGNTKRFWRFIYLIFLDCTLHFAKRLATGLCSKITSGRLANPATASVVLGALDQKLKVAEDAGETRIKGVFPYVGFGAGNYQDKNYYPHPLDHFHPGSLLNTHLMECAASVQKELGETDDSHIYLTFAGSMEGLDVSKSMALRLGTAVAVGANATPLASGEAVNSAGNSPPGMLSTYAKRRPPNKPLDELTLPPPHSLCCRTLDGKGRGEWNTAAELVAHKAAHGSKKKKVAVDNEGAPRSQNRHRKKEPNSKPSSTAVFSSQPASSSPSDTIDAASHFTPSPSLAGVSSAASLSPTTQATSKKKKPAAPKSKAKQPGRTLPTSTASNDSPSSSPSAPLSSLPDAPQSSDLTSPSPSSSATKCQQKKAAPKAKAPPADPASLPCCLTRAPKPRREIEMDPGKPKKKGSNRDWDLESTKEEMDMEKKTRTQKKTPGKKQKNPSGAGSSGSIGQHRLKYGSYHSALGDVVADLPRLHQLYHQYRGDTSAVSEAWGGDMEESYVRLLCRSGETGLDERWRVFWGGDVDPVKGPIHLTLREITITLEKHKPASQSWRQLAEKATGSAFNLSKLSGSRGELDRVPPSEYAFASSASLRVLTPRHRRSELKAYGYAIAFHFFFRTTTSAKLAYGTRSLAKQYSLPLVDPSHYPRKRATRRRRRSTPPALDNLPDSPSSGSESGSATSTSPSTARQQPIMATFTIPTAYQPGKPPLLLQTSPSGISSFTRAARLFFRQKKIEADKDKISYLGEGLVGFPELYNWYNASADAHEAKAYKIFVADLQKKALPRDFVWEAKGRIRWARQDGQDYEDWVTAMRTEHLALTEAVMPLKEFVESLLYGMDSELSVILCNGTSLKNSGLHQDEMANLAFPSTTPTVYMPTVDYTAFDVEARMEWAKIASRRMANAAQLKALNKKVSSTTSTSSSHGLTTTKNITIKKEPTTPSGNIGSRTAKLTDLEKDWLSATEGCFKCRESWVDHSASWCKRWPTAGYVVPVPPGWDSTKEVPAALRPRQTSTTTATAGSAPVTEFRALHLYGNSDSEVDLPESLAQDSDTDTDGYALPPLSLLVGSKRHGRSVDALADSGSGLSLISDKVVSELGLERRKLSRPKAFRLAIQGGGDCLQSLTEFVQVPLALENGTWKAGTTTLIVAPLEPPFDIILGTPFLRQHQINIAFSPDPALLILQPAPLDPIDLYAEAEGPATQLEVMEAMGDEERDEIIGTAVETLVASVNAKTEEEREMATWAARLMDEFNDLFPSVLPALTADYLAKTTTRHRIKFVDIGKTHNQRGFNVPRKWRERWKRMLEEHIATGRLRPSTSPFASAAFIIPRKDPDADPRWVNDYRGLNSNTIKDRTPLPLPDVVLSDAALAKYWGKIDTTNAFFQTPMAEEDIEKTAIKTPRGLFEWTVMPQGLCNAPATHQARVNEALRHLIGVCCQAFVDDVIIYSATLEEHEQNCRAVLSALRAAGLYCSKKKTDSFSLRTESLGHVISRGGIEADPSKVEKIKNWTRPSTVSQVRGFLGLVQYLRKFIPQLAEHTAGLTPLTKKGLTCIDDLWTEKEQRAFEATKGIVTSLPVLKPVDQDSEEPIWLMTNASKVGIGAYIAAEKNYPTHEQELLAVVAALKAWRIDLLGVRFRVLTDHDTLKHFQTQATLSKRQARWTEVLADYDFELSYIPGKQNAVADSLSRFSLAKSEEDVLAVCGISAVSLSHKFTTELSTSYVDDPFCSQVVNNLGSSSAFKMVDGLLYFEETRLVVPDNKKVRETLLHDALGHLGPKKTMAALAASFYWPGMSKSVLAYVSSCDGCQRHKSRTTRRAGKLHSLLVPPRAFSDVALDFVGPLPLSEGKDMMLTIMDRLTGYTRLLACRSKDGAKDVAELVFSGWFSLFGLPERLVSDRDELFTSRFWRALHERVGVALQMSTSFHPETDGRSERTNKTVVQILRQQVSRQQKDWVRFLPSTEYGINAAVNDVTGHSLFDLVLGFTPSLLPSPSSPPSSLPAVKAFLEERKIKIGEARDALAAAKVRQAEQANKRRGPDWEFKVGDLVMVDSADRRSRYKTKGGDVRAAKLFPRWDRPYPVEAAFASSSTYRLTLPPDDRAHPVFHSSKLKRYIPNDASLHSSREPPRPEPIDVEGEKEYIVEAIVDEKGKGRRRRSLVKWEGYLDSDNTWEPLGNVEDTAAMEVWEGRGQV